MCYGLRNQHGNENYILYVGHNNPHPLTVIFHTKSPCQVALENTLLYQKGYVLYMFYSCRPYPWKSSTFIKVPLSRLTRGVSLSVWLAFIRFSTSFSHWLTAGKDFTLMPQFSAAFITSWCWQVYFVLAFLRAELARVVYNCMKERFIIH